MTCNLAPFAAPETASAALAAVMASASVAFSLSYDMTHCRTCNCRDAWQTFMDPVAE
jgi:hypothetical protein